MKITRAFCSFSIERLPDFEAQLLLWAAQFDPVLWLGEGMLAVGAHSSIKGTDFQQFKKYQERTNDYLFGYLSYDLKNDLEALHSDNYDGLEFPALFFFQPQKLIVIKEKHVEFQYLSEFENEMSSDFEAIKKAKGKTNIARTPIYVQPRISKEVYFEKINTLLAHIHKGDVYEVNFCQEFYATNATIDPLSVYQELSAISKAPFAAFLKMGEHYALCASPERYLKKSGSSLISQPIKGTAKRGATVAEDVLLRTALQNDPKERAENCMIVDLVRNDLSRIATRGSVRVQELCGLYSFEQVHQLISTISCEVAPETSLVAILTATFPMGSMTGTPKIAAMKLIETLEETKRGVYSGAMGYVTPTGDFDFNVVIRSVLYNEAARYLSYSVGGAITAKSVVAKEYEECLVKAAAMKEVLVTSRKV